MKVLKKFQKTIIFLLKVCLYFGIFALFFGLMGINNESLFRLSRTSVVTVFTFTVLETAMVSVYGGYQIGILKSKPIVYSMTIATIITDLVTHLQLCIMNTNETNDLQFVYKAPHMLALAIVLQFLLILSFAYFGNYVYFSINSPEKCCIVIPWGFDLDEILPKIHKYKKQYKIQDVVLCGSKKVHEVIDRNDSVFFFDVPSERRKPLVEYCYAKNKNIYYSFEMRDVVSVGAKNMLLDDKPMMASLVKGLTLEQRFIKRAIDLIGSAAALFLTSPIMLFCAIAIKAEDRGPVFYKQKRLTYRGKTFYVYKFRSMVQDAEKNGAQWATDNDDRITKVGRVLRKFRIDELPQFINIFKGDMSFVGPRPERPELASEFYKDLPEFAYRLNVKAGLTGLAQVYGKYNTTPKDKLTLDLIYIERFSIWQDIKLLLQTLLVFFKASESTEGTKKSKHSEEYTIIE